MLFQFLKKKNFTVPSSLNCAIRIPSTGQNVHLTRQQLHDGTKAHCKTLLSTAQGTVYNLLYTIKETKTKIKTKKSGRVGEID